MNETDADPPGSPLREAGVGRWGLGTWLFGWETPVDQAHRLMGLALEHGVTYFDTANNYGHGQSERIVGQFVKRIRDQVVIGTKVYAPFGPNPADRGLSADAVRRATEQSLRRLDTDYIDLLYLHRPDPAVPAKETAEALAGLVRQGKVRAVGTSTFRGTELDAMQRALVAAGISPTVCDQAPYSLLERAVEQLTGEALRRWSIGVVAWSPLAEGLLTGKYRDAGVAGRLTRWSLMEQPRFRAGIERAAVFQKLADEYRVTLSELALCWPRQRSLVECVLIGARTPEQFDTYLSSDQVELPAEVDVRVDTILGPGQTVLHHYAT
ncbi:MAG TPA: aldo/keto reductase [Micromonosporaceae bacterium]|jgi:aryl-alcohol dehydrogenase (NADP+)|nr:aldo/keto reductase [Micromonosporaceae bacterium]